MVIYLLPSSFSLSASSLPSFSSLLPPAGRGALSECGDGQGGSGHAHSGGGLGEGKGHRKKHCPKVGRRRRRRRRRRRERERERERGGGGGALCPIAIMDMAMYTPPHRYEQYVEEAYVEYLKERDRPDEVQAHDHVLGVKPYSFVHFPLLPR